MSDFTAIQREPSLASRVTASLLEAISSGRFASGSNLPSERELSDQFGVSRTVIREAVRGLEAKGVLDVRSGRGATVVAVSPRRVSETLDLYLRSAQSAAIIQADDIADVRRTLEIRLVQLAVERATDDELAAIEASIRAMEDAGSVEERGVADADFHRQIAVATHNTLYVTLLDAINAPMMSIRVRSLALEGRVGRAVAQHRAVYDALVARNATGAVEAMADHLADSAHYYSDDDGQAAT